MDKNVGNDAASLVALIEEYFPEFPVTIQQMEYPTSEFVIGYYVQFKDRMKLLLDQIIDNRTAETSMQLKSDGDPVFSLLRFVNKYLMKLTDQVDCTLTLTDFYVPTAKRTKLRFRLLLNLLIYYEDQVEEIKSTVSKQLLQAEAHSRKKTEKEQYKIELAKKAEDLARGGDELQKLQKELSKAALRYASLQEQKDDFNRHCKKLQRDLKVHVDTHQNKQTLLTNIKTNIQHLNEQVVAEESFKSLQDLKENLAKKCAELEAEASYTATNLESRMPTIEHFNNIEKQLQTASCEELKASQKMIDRNNAVLKSSKVAYKQKEEEIQKLGESKLKYREEMKGINEAIQSEAIKNATMFDQIKRKIEQVNVEAVEEESFQSSICKDVTTFQGKISFANKKCARLTTDIEKFNVHCADIYKKMLSDENTITNNFNEVLGNIAKNFCEAVNSNGHEI